MKKELIISGTGGQGIKLLGDLIAEAAFDGGLEATSYPIYTPAARGGEIVSYIVISDREINYPLPVNADLAVILGSPVPRKLIMDHVSEKTFVVFTGDTLDLPAGLTNRIYVPELNRGDISNMVVLGTVSRQIPELPIRHIHRIIKKKFGQARYNGNKLKFKTGWNLIKTK